MIQSSNFSRALREAAPGLSKRFFECSGRRNASPLYQLQGPYSASTSNEQQLLRRQVRNFSSKAVRCASPVPKLKPCSSLKVPRTSLPAKWSIRALSQSARATNTSTLEASAGTNTQDAEDGQTGEEEPKRRKSFFPDTSSNVVAYWLLGSAASVFGIVVFGGLTRLTESGYVFPEAQRFGCIQSVVSSTQVKNAC